MSENEWLKNLIDSKAPILVIIKSVAKSGMTRSMELYIMEDDVPLRITHIIAKLGEFRTNKDYYLTIKGSGMDMVSHVISVAMAYLYSGKPPRVKHFIL